MIVDSSAILAVFFQEADAPWFAARIAGAASKRMSAASYLECGIRLDRHAGVPVPDLDLYLEAAAIEIVAVTPAQARIARLAYQRFGKGNHPAGLNFGDCFAYALAWETGEPLLYKGGDFARTDVTPVP